MRTRTCGGSYFVGLAITMLLLAVGPGRAISSSIIYFAFSGTIQTIEGKTVTLRCVKPNAEEISIQIDETTSITLGGMNAALEELKTGQTARVVTINGQAIRFEAKTR